MPGMNGPWPMNGMTTAFFLVFEHSVLYARILQTMASTHVAFKGTYDQITLSEIIQPGFVKSNFPVLYLQCYHERNITWPD